MMQRHTLWISDISPHLRRQLGEGANQDLLWARPGALLFSSDKPQNVSHLLRKRM